MLIVLIFNQLWPFCYLTAALISSNCHGYRKLIRRRENSMKNSIAKHSWFVDVLFLEYIVFKFVCYDTNFLSLCIVRILEKIIRGRKQ